MRAISRDNLPHLVDCTVRRLKAGWSTAAARLAAAWWGIELGHGCTFAGLPHFRRHPGSRIIIGPRGRFNSSPASNWIGVNHPCLISTLTRDAELTIGENCGFSGTVIACARRIVLGRNVRCGANTLINDTDWHSDDPRSGGDEMVAIGDDVWLGVNVTVLKGVTIGAGTLVGAGSVVVKSLPDGVIAEGVPARVIKLTPVARP
jgi:acetyltransferase-like isoleucine patch superfamily enzyme